MMKTIFFATLVAIIIGISVECGPLVNIKATLILVTKWSKFYLKARCQNDGQCSRAQHCSSGYCVADQQQWVNLGNNQWIQTGIGQGRWVQVNGQWIRV